MILFASFALAEFLCFTSALGGRFLLEHSLFIEQTFLVEVLHLHGMVEQHLHISDSLGLSLQVFHARRKVALQDFFPHLLNDGHGHIVKELKAIGVSEERVPESHAVSHIELLAHQKHEPP